MDDAVNRIVKAKNEGETVVIFGDYDADGICATTLLYRALKDFGIDAIISGSTTATTGISCGSTQTNLRLFSSSVIT